MELTTLKLQPKDFLHRSLTTSLLYFKDSPSSLFCIASNIIYLPSFPRASTSHPPGHYLPFPFQLTPPLCYLLVEIPGKTFVVLDFMLFLRHGGDYERATELSSSSSVCRLPVPFESGQAQSNLVCDNQSQHSTPMLPCPPEQQLDEV